MIRFLDGPAETHALMLRRAPKHLRVVDGPKGWDGLDQLSDTPAPNEQVFTYRREGGSGMCHILIRSKTRSGGFFATGQYRFCDPQPTEAEMRETAAWRDWCRSQPK